jgi:hypothetical protein
MEVTQRQKEGGGPVTGINGLLRQAACILPAAYGGTWSRYLVGEGVQLSLYEENFRWDILFVPVPTAGKIHSRQCDQ